MWVVYGHSSSHICCDGATGSDRVRMRNRKWRDRQRPWTEVTEVIACACTTGTFCTTTIVAIQNVSLRMTDRATGCDVTPKGVPSDAHMRNRKLGFPPFFRVFWPEMTLPVRLKTKKQKNEKKKNKKIKNWKSTGKKYGENEMSYNVTQVTSI